MRTPQHKAWTGGSAPRPLPEVSRDERRYISHLFREQCETFRAFWGDLPGDVRRIFWNRARYDAHATFRA